MNDLAEGGLSFLAAKQYPAGTLLELTLPVKDKWLTLKANVVHAEQDPLSKHYRTGVSFSNPSHLFQLKLVEQIHQIDEYRKIMSKEKGRPVSEEEAARKWIQERSAQFAEFYQ